MKTVVLILSTLLIVAPSLSDDPKWIQFDIEPLEERVLFREQIDSGVEIVCQMEISDLRQTQRNLPAVSIIFSRSGVFPFGGRIEQAGRFSVFKTKESEKYNYDFSGFGIGIDFAAGFGWKEAGDDVREFMVAWPDDGTIRYAVGPNLKNVIIEQHSDFQPRYWVLTAVGVAGQIRCISTEI
jgi:hypothetical protein